MSRSSNFEALDVERVREVLDHMVEYISDGHFYVADGPGIHPRFSVPPWHGQWGKHFTAEDRHNYIRDTCIDLRNRAEYQQRTCLA